jgi:hypothetical protein
MKTPTDASTRTTAMMIATVSAVVDMGLLGVGICGWLA